MAAFVPAHPSAYSVGGNLPISRLVIHCTESSERPDGAEANARFFHGPHDSKGSAHWVFDSDSEVRCVQDKDVAFHAPPNTHSLGYEIVGKAAQTEIDWADDFSEKAIRRCARQVAADAILYGIPLVWLTPADLKAGKRGITSHANVSLAFRKSTHTDPGPNFPVAHFMALVTEFAGGSAPPAQLSTRPQAPQNGPIISTGDDVPAINSQVVQIATDVAGAATAGCGWTRILAPTAKVAWVGRQGAYPATDGYKFGRKDLDGFEAGVQLRDIDGQTNVIVEVTKATPGATVPVVVYWQ